MSPYIGRPRLNPVSEHILEPVSKSLSALVPHLENWYLDFKALGEEHEEVEGQNICVEGRYVGES